MQTYKCLNKSKQNYPTPYTKKYYKLASIKCVYTHPKQSISSYIARVKTFPRQVLQRCFKILFVFDSIRTLQEQKRYTTFQDIIIISYLLNRRMFYTVFKAEAEDTVYETRLQTIRPNLPREI